jgi:hypothetical protein
MPIKDQHNNRATDDSARASDPTLTTTNGQAGLPRDESADGAFSSYSEAELQQLLWDIRQFDEDSYISAAHSAAVKD